MRPRLALSVILLFAVDFALCAVAQEAPEEPKNLQVYPKDTKRSDLVLDMRQFSFALGVACTHCHGTEEQTGFDLRGVDFALDLKPTKAKAREMLRLVDEINSKLLPRVPDRSPFGLQVSCATCHSGLALPETIESRVLRTLRAQGIDAAIADYRATRERYYGRAAYDFGEQRLVEVAHTLFAEDSFEAVAAISRLNLEFHPDSAQSKVALADALAKTGDLEEARRIYGELLAARPDNERLRQKLESLGPPG